MDNKDIIRLAKEINPMQVYKEEHGYLVLIEEHKEVLKSKTFEPNKHVFAAITLSKGVKFYQMNSEDSNAFKKYVEKCEENAKTSPLPYTYVGKSNSQGKIIL